MASQQDQPTQVVLIDDSMVKLVEHQLQADDGGNHFTRLVAPFLAGFSLPTIGQLVANSSQPGRDLALALFVTAAGLLLAGFQLSIGTLSKDDLSSWISGPVAFSGVAALTAGLIVLIWNATDVRKSILILPALVILCVGVFGPIGMRMTKNRTNWRGLLPGNVWKHLKPPPKNPQQRAPGGP